MTNIFVVGLGYVGLPVALEAAHNGNTVYGIDSDISKVNRLNSGESYIEDIENKTISTALNSGNFEALSELPKLESESIILICVPTPLDKNHDPDLSYLLRAAEDVGRALVKGCLVIVESTVQPGACRNIIVPILEKYSKLTREDFYFAFSPERIDPSNRAYNIKNTPKLVAGLTPEAANKSSDFYSQFVSQVNICGSIEVAETAKLLENSFRLINISFINELSIFCSKFGISINQVIEAASTKPYGFMPFYPSVGVGGHCIPVDPLYLASTARGIGTPIKFIDLANEINRGMPEHFIFRSEEKLGGLQGKKLIVIGVAYKPNVADVRETPVEALIAGLKSKGAQVYWHDDLVKEWNGEKSVALSSDFDLAILATPHDYLDLTKLENVPVLNTRGSI
jgi:UDP-N-acetyl-D-glucosamine dehydrogenase